MFVKSLAALINPLHSVAEMAKNSSRKNHHKSKGKPKKDPTVTPQKNSSSKCQHGVGRINLHNENGAQNLQNQYDESTINDVGLEESSSIDVGSSTDNKQAVVHDVIDQKVQSESEQTSSEGGDGYVKKQHGGNKCAKSHSGSGSTSSSVRGKPILSPQAGDMEPIMASADVESVSSNSSQHVSFINDDVENAPLSVTTSDGDDGQARPDDSDDIQVLRQRLSEARREIRSLKRAHMSREEQIQHCRAVKENELADVWGKYRRLVAVNQHLSRQVESLLPSVPPATDVFKQTCREGGHQSPRRDTSEEVLGEGGDLLLRVAEGVQREHALEIARRMVTRALVGGQVNISGTGGGGGGGGEGGGGGSKSKRGVKSSLTKAWLERVMR